MILAGDIGGTKTVLARFTRTRSGLRLRHERVFASADYASFDDVLAAFLGAERGRIRAACFGVAGPVIDGRVRVTNLPWVLDEAALAAALEIRRVRLLNDLEATAYGTLFLAADERRVLQPGSEPPVTGNIAVIAAGTGLGEAMLHYDGSAYHPLASEGGHCDFAPRNDEEIALLRHLRAAYGGHVSYERVLSGPGVLNIYRFLRAANGEPEPAWLAERVAAGDPSAAIAEAGLAATDRTCARTLALFAEIYGAEAGNLALKCLALGGVVVAGGIAPKILPALETGSFLRGFTDKGRFAGMMQRVRVTVALNPRVALLGAAHFALRR